ncbi:hypothetical protein [Acinetobacter soli]|uniref:hypothetical protein n=1 Tax=Acinetobacter soli TaxID=487316 RepID=UPI0020918B0D|nr:hypothetical protein [Acinetobacter soli]
MIDLEKEREAFQEHFNGEYEYVFGECFNKENEYFYEGKHDKSAYFAFEAWKKCAESKQAEIDSLKAQLAKVESGEYVVVPKEPTLKMLKVADKHVMDCNATPESAYKAMIEAAQENSHE